MGLYVDITLPDTTPCAIYSTNMAAIPNCEVVATLVLLLLYCCRLLTFCIVIPQFFE